MSDQKNSLSVPAPAGSVSNFHFFGPAPLLPGESIEQYDDLYCRVAAAIKPVDIIDEICLRDYVDSSWEIFRLRRLKTAQIAGHARDGLKRLLGTWMDLAADCSSLSKNWSSGDAAAVERVNQLLKSAGVDQNAIAAETFALKMDVIERLDQMIMRREAFRNTTLREIDRRRAALAQSAVKDFEDAELVLEPKRVTTSKKSA